MVNTIHFQLPLTIIWWKVPKVLRRQNSITPHFPVRFRWSSLGNESSYWKKQTEIEIKASLIKKKHATIHSKLTPKQGGELHCVSIKVEKLFVLNTEPYNKTKINQLFPISIIRELAKLAALAWLASSDFYMKSVYWTDWSRRFDTTSKSPPSLLNVKLRNRMVDSHNLALYCLIRRLRTPSSNVCILTFGPNTIIFGNSLHVLATNFRKTGSLIPLSWWIWTSEILIGMSKYSTYKDHDKL